MRAPRTIRRSRHSVDFPRLLKGANDDRELTRAQDRWRDTHRSRGATVRKSHPTPLAIGWSNNRREEESSVGG